MLLVLAMREWKIEMNKGKKVSEYSYDRPLDKLRATIRFFFVVIGVNVTNVFTGTPFFIFAWFYIEWCYWTFGVPSMKAYLFLAGIKIKTIGLEKINLNRPAVYVSNHQSHMDIPAQMAALGIRFYFVAKKELGKIPIFGWALPVLGMFMIDRSTTEKAYESIRKAARSIKRENKNVLIYPEGGISKTGRIKDFKKGAFALAIAAGVPIVPLLVSGSGKLFSAHRRESRPGIMEIEVLDEVDTSGYSEKDKQELMEKVHKIFVRATKRNSTG